MREIKTNSLSDILLAWLGTVVFVGMLSGVILILDIKFEENIDWAKEKDQIYPLIGFFILGYMILINNIQRWTSILMRQAGGRLYNRKHIDGFPINEEDSGYRAVEADILINETSRGIYENKQLGQWEQSVWYQNMEFRYDSYSKRIKSEYRKFKKKLTFNKILPKWIQKQHKIDTIKLVLEDNRKHSELLSEFLYSINNYNKDEVVKLNDKLDEIYIIQPLEYDHQILLDNQPGNIFELIDKMRESKLYQIFMDLVSIGFAILVVINIRKYTLNSGHLNSTDRLTIFIVLAFFLSKVPTTAINAVKRFKMSNRTKLKRAYVFRKYLNDKPYKVERNKLMQKEKEHLDFIKKEEDNNDCTDNSSDTLSINSNSTSISKQEEIK